MASSPARMTGACMASGLFGVLVPLTQRRFGADPRIEHLPHHRNRYRRHGTHAGISDRVGTLAVAFSPGGRTCLGAECCCIPDDSAFRHRRPRHQSHRRPYAVGMAPVEAVLIAGAFVHVPRHLSVRFPSNRTASHAGPRRESLPLAMSVTGHRRKLRRGCDVSCLAHLE